MAEETNPGQEPEEQEEKELSPQTAQMTRRQFLVGAGTGVVVGAAGVAGVIALNPSAPPQTQVAQVQAPAVAPPIQVATNLPLTMRQVTLNINGKDYSTTTDVRRSLWEVMTYDLGLVGANLGCDRAQCGACAVVIDGRAVNSCTVLAARLGRGQKIISIEGLAKGSRPEDLHPIQRAYWQEGGFQCGICTRGFIMSTYALLTKNPTPTEDEVREAVSGNICRCSEYPKIYESVFRAADEMRKKA